MKKLYPLIIAGLVAGLISSCSKSNKNPNGNTTNGPSKVGSTLDLIKDSIYLYADEDYLWNNQLPTYSKFNPRSFSNADDLTALQNEMDALSQYAINPATNAPYEYSTNSPGSAKYSFIDNGTETAALNGTKGDFGLDVQYNLVNDLRIAYVYPGSPAGLAGIKRGYEITAINNNTSISYDGKGYGTGTGTNLNFVSNAIYNSTSITLTLLKPDQTSFTVTINTANYNVNPVLKDTVFDQGNGHKVGYIVFNSFTSDAVADPVLDAAFQNFATKGVTDLVVDLRYNGGGYVSTAEHLDNLIVPAAKTGTNMYTTYYNSNLQNDIHPLLSKQYNIQPGDFKPQNNTVNFSKVGGLNVNRVFFIITGGTASASELTINNLRPSMDVQYIGKTSYGKPVGFFGISINKYIMYTPEFYVQNSAGQGGYYAGFSPGTAGYPGVDDYDDLTKDFGDPTEGLLAHALNYVKNGTYGVSKQVTQSVGSNNSFAVPINYIDLHPKKSRFTGMIFKTTQTNKLRSKKVQ